MSFEFAKYQALGNDYLVIDPNKTKINLNKKRGRKKTLNGFLPV